MPPSEGHAEDTADQKYEFLKPVGVFTWRPLAHYIAGHDWLVGQSLSSALKSNGFKLSLTGLFLFKHA